MHAILKKNDTEVNQRTSYSFVKKKVDRLGQVRTTQKARTKGQIINEHKFAVGRKSLLHFNVEISLQYGTNYRMAITYSRSSFCCIFYDCKSSCESQ